MISARRFAQSPTMPQPTGLQVRPGFAETIRANTSGKRCLVLANQGRPKPFVCYCRPLRHDAAIPLRRP
jgi:hypothetical protein